MSSSTVALNPFSQVIAAVRDGRPVVIIDDAQRENEGDLAVATECLTPAHVSLMMHEARGLICVSIPSTIAQRLNLPLQVLDNNSPFQTPFAVSVDLRASGTRGVTAAARCAAMRHLLDANAQPDDFVSPGHVFPLITHPVGVIGRQGQTEGSADLARIAGFTASGVICEILNDDGTMARGSQLNRFAERLGVPVTSVEEILHYRIGQEIVVRRGATATLGTDYGLFTTTVFADDVEGKEHLALIYGAMDTLGAETDAEGKPLAPPLVRLHSECLTGDVFGSRRCDCGAQLAASLRAVVAAGRGAVLYLRQEGRGIGLANKLLAYQLQDQGHDTVEANVKLGFAPDERDFAVAVNILATLGVRRVRLLTNNPDKIAALTRYGLTVMERVPVIVPPDEFSKDYLETKRTKMGHLL